MIILEKIQLLVNQNHFPHQQYIYIKLVKCSTHYFPNASPQHTQIYVQFFSFSMLVLTAIWETLGNIYTYISGCLTCIATVKKQSNIVTVHQYLDIPYPEMDDILIQHYQSQNTYFSNHIA